MNSFEFFPLDKTFDRTHFDCGSSDLNNFIKTKARQNQSVGFNKTFVAIARGDESKRVLGYYSLSMGEIHLEDLPSESAKKLPKHPVPIARMGRLAVDNSTKGLGLGKFLLVNAMKRILAASELVGVYALLVDAKDGTARNFYLKYGFTPLVTESMTLFLTLSAFPK